MSMFASWRHCTKIILGASHDNGYSRALSKLVTDNITPGKVALLQGPPFAAELAQFTPIFPRLQFGDLFMNKKLEAAGASYGQVAATGGSPPPRKASSPTRPAAVVPSKSTIMKPEPGSSFPTYCYLANVQR
jgi:hypothetical protein